MKRQIAAHPVAAALAGAAHPVAAALAEAARGAAAAVRRGAAGAARAARTLAGRTAAALPIDAELPRRTAAIVAAGPAATLITPATVFARRLTAHSGQTRGSGLGAGDLLRGAPDAEVGQHRAPHQTAHPPYGLTA